MVFRCSSQPTDGKRKTLPMRYRPGTRRKGHRAYQKLLPTTVWTKSSPGPVSSSLQAVPLQASSQLASVISLCTESRARGETSALGVTRSVTQFSLWGRQLGNILSKVNACAIGSRKSTSRNFCYGCTGLCVKWLPSVSRDSLGHFFQ
jgi:hypothetical protein